MFVTLSQVIKQHCSRQRTTLEGNIVLSAQRYLPPVITMHAQDEDMPLSQLKCDGKITER